MTIPLIPHLRVSVTSLFILEKGEWSHLDDLDNILYISSLANYVIIQCQRNKKVTAIMTMKELVILLPKSKFIRIHRQYIVNLEFAKEYHEDTLYMKNGKSFPIGRVYEKAAKALIPIKMKQKQKSFLKK